MMADFSLEELQEATGGSLSGKAAGRMAVVTDTRKIEPGVAFLALKGERFDGEDFAAKAAKAGASLVIVSDTCPAEKVACCPAVLRVPDTLRAYQNIGHFWREKFHIPVVAITGSNGKTTTKDLTAAVLSARGPVAKTQANYNNEVGLPLTLLSITAEDTAAVVEIGMRGLHQIEAMAPIADPSIAIVTNVGETHMELLGSIENIARAKGELVEAMGPGGTVILNGDDERVAAMREKAAAGVRVLTFGIDEEADVRGSEIHTEGSSATRFTATYQGEIHEYTVSMVGRHNVLNTLAAITAGFAAGLAPKEIQAGLEKLQATKMRFETRELKGYHIVNDAYNASPMSMKAALATLQELIKGRKVAVLGDMLELGSIEQEAHERVGREVAEYGFSALVTYGSLGHFIAEGARAAGLKEVYATDSHEEAAKALQGLLQPGDTVLFKGSRGMAMEKIIPMI